eukprot:1143673-Pelagomonas_calceolata.AAC.1
MIQNRDCKVMLLHGTAGAAAPRAHRPPGEQMHHAQAQEQNQISQAKTGTPGQTWADLGRLKVFKIVGARPCRCCCL